MKEIRFRAWEKEKMKVRKGSKGMYKQNGYVLAKAPYHPSANKRGYVPLHTLVMENQLGRYLTPRKELVHHIDGNKLNNHKSNLEWCTNESNIRHAFETGLRSSSGENNPKAKLKEKDIREIRKIYKDKKMTALELSKLYGVTRTNIYEIVNYKIWKDVI